MTICNGDKQWQQGTVALRQLCTTHSSACASQPKISQMPHGDLFGPENVSMHAKPKQLFTSPTCFSGELELGIPHFERPSFCLQLKERLLFAAMRDQTHTKCLNCTLCCSRKLLSTLRTLVLQPKTMNFCIKHHTPCEVVTDTFGPGF